MTFVFFFIVLSPNLTVLATCSTPHPPGGTPLYKLWRYVLLQGLGYGFWAVLVWTPNGHRFWPLWSSIGYGFQEDRVGHFNSKWITEREVTKIYHLSWFLSIIDLITQQQSQWKNFNNNDYLRWIEWCFIYTLKKNRGQKTDVENDMSSSEIRIWRTGWHTPPRISSSTFPPPPPMASKSAAC